MNYDQEKAAFIRRGTRVSCYNRMDYGESC
jgi:hypothetical protein